MPLALPVLSRCDIWIKVSTGKASGTPNQSCDKPLECDMYERTTRTLAAVLIALTSQVTRGDDWPQWRGPSRDGVWRESGLIERFDKPQIDILWRTKIGPGYSGPTVSKGRVFVTDRRRTVEFPPYGT